MLARAEHPVRVPSMLGSLELGSDANLVRWPERYADKRGQVMWDTVTRLLNFAANRDQCWPAA